MQAVVGRGGYPYSGRPLAGRYEILEVVGHGAQGEVWLARDVDSQRRVAIKSRAVTGRAPSSSAAAEASVLLRLPPHPSIPTVRDDFVIDGRYHLVMDWVEGRNLGELVADAVEADRPLPFDDVIRWLSEVGDAVDHLHRNEPPVYHGDIKPENIVIGRDGRAVLVDFGLSGSRPAPDYLRGTPAYRAPEVGRGQPATVASDVFGLGAVAFAALTGVPPLPGAALAMPAVPDASVDAVRDALARALAIDPTRRPGSAGELARAIGASTTRHRAVGRRPELDRARHALRGAAAGAGGALLVAGDPGIGKSTFLGSVADAAADEGFRVAWGRCWEGRSSPAYLPWVQVVASLVSTHPHALDRLATAERTVLARLLPEFDPAATVRATPSGDGSKPAEDLVVLATAVLGVLRTVAAETPVLLLLDDLHMADRSTIRLLGRVASALGDIGVLLVGAHRTAEAAVDPWLAARLDSIAPGDATLRLAGLAGDDFRALVEQLGGPTDGGSLAFLGATTEGNPFFAYQLVHLGLSSTAGHPDDVPENAREAVRRRVARLGPEVRRALDVASVIGRTFDQAVLAAVVDDDVAAALHQAADDRILRPAAGDVWSFRHDVFHEALRVDLPVADRRSLHRMVGEAIEATAADLGAVLPALATHFAESGDPAVAAKAIHYGQAAGRQAVDRMAYDEAIAHYERALDLVDPESDPRTRCHLLVDLGEAQWRAWDSVATASALLEALPTAARLGEWELVVRSTRTLQIPPTWLIDAQEDALARAIQHTGARDQRARVHLLACFVEQDVDARKGHRNRPLAEEAVALATALGDDAALERALQGQRAVLIGTPEAVRRSELADRRLALLRLDPHRDPLRELAALRDCVFERFVAADRPGTEAMVAEAHALVEVHPSFLGSWALVGWRSALDLNDGRFADAAQGSDLAFEMGLAEEADGRGRHGVSAGWFLQQGALRLHRGGFGDLAPLMEAALAATPWTAMRCALAAALAHAGRRDEAADLVGELTADGCATVPLDSTWGVAATLLGEAISVLGAPAAAEVLYERLLPYEGLNEPSPLWASAGYGCLSRPLGVLAGLLGDRGVAEAHFATAAEVHERFGSRAWAARGDAEHAAVLERLGGAGDRATIERLRSGALAAATELGMEPLVTTLVGRS